jgi:hypothetical protein
MGWIDDIRDDARWSVQREREALDGLRYRARLVASRLEELLDPLEYDQA